MTTDIESLISSLVQDSTEDSIARVAGLTTRLAQQADQSGESAQAPAGDEEIDTDEIVEIVEQLKAETDTLALALGIDPDAPAEEAAEGQETAEEKPEEGDESPAAQQEEKKNEGPTETSSQNQFQFGSLDDVQKVALQLKAAAEIPAKNFARIALICGHLDRAADLARRPQYASIRPRLATITKKVAGFFADVDTNVDLDIQLASLETAIQALYSDKNRSASAYNRKALVVEEEKAEPVLQPGLGFHLLADGTWGVEEIPKQVLENNVFSGYLTIEGYRSIVFETPSMEQWAQKSSGTSALASQLAIASLIK